MKSDFDLNKPIAIGSDHAGVVEAFSLDIEQKSMSYEISG